MTTRRLIYTFAAAALLAVLVGAHAWYAPAYASSSLQQKAQPDIKRGSWLVQLDEATNDPKAVGIVRKLYAREISELNDLNMGEPQVYARFISVGPGKSQTSIAATLAHPAVCGAHQCQTLIFEHMGGNRYRTALDVVTGPFYLNTSGQSYYQILVPNPQGKNDYAVWTMNANKKRYELTARGTPRRGN